MSIVSGMSAIKLYLAAQQAKGLVYNVSYLGGDLISYETHWNMHCEVITPEVQRLAEEHKCYVEMQAGVLAAGETAIVSQPADYVFVTLDLIGVWPARIVRLKAEVDMEG